MYNINNSDEINKIVIDPGVISSKYSAELFVHCLNLERVNFKGWDTSNVENLSEMFCTCPKI